MNRNAAPTWMTARMATSWSRPILCPPSEAGDPFGARVDVEPVAAEEADEGHAQPPPDLDRQVRRRGHGAQDREPGDGRLLRDLERDPTRHEQDPVVQWQAPGQELGPDELVERVVAADVLAQRDQSSLGV